MQKTVLFLLLVSVLSSSCLVTKKKFKEEELRNMSLRKENESLTDELNKLKGDKSNLEKSQTELSAENSQLKKDTTDCGKKLRDLQNKYKQLNSLYEDQVDQNKALLSSSTSERQKLLKELDDKQKELFDKEKALDKKQDDINNLTSQLNAREKRVKELEDLIAQKDAAVNKLRKSIEDALLGFDKNELSVTMKDGKIYVSLSEKLLFQSGSTEVDKKGKDALNKLASVLEKQQDITIMIEGHTDNVPIKTACMKDNWDLSVLRATSIVRILTVDNKVDDKQVVPSGRGEYLPVAPNTTKEDRARNRRTEIILSPNLDKIFKILEGK
jgi:chemotaxis protein MotB